MTFATRRRKVVSSLFVAFCAGSVLLALVPLAFVLFFVVSQGIQSLNLAFFTHMPVPTGETGGGMANAIVGSLIVVGLGALFAIPIGILSGIYMSEYAGTRFASLVRFAADTLNGVPSIVIGVFIYGIAVLPFKQFSAFAGGLALGVMMIPIIARTTEELLLLVPGTMREGALALGATHARAVFTVVVPSAAPRHHDRHRARDRAHCRRDGAAVVHIAQQPVLHDEADAADLIAHRAGVHLRKLPVSGPASSGLGGRPRSRRDRPHVFASCPVRDATAREHEFPLKTISRD